MTTSFRITGLNELQKKLKKLNSDIDEIAKERAVSFDELLPPSFMRKHTQFSSFKEMVEKSPFKVESAEDFKKLPDAERDPYVRAKTSFSNWQEMISRAAEEYQGKRVQAAIKKVKD